MAGVAGVIRGTRWGGLGGGYDDDGDDDGDEEVRGHSSLTLSECKVSLARYGSVSRMDMRPAR